MGWFAPSPVSRLRLSVVTPSTTKGRNRGRSRRFRFRSREIVSAAAPPRYSSCSSSSSAFHQGTEVASVAPSPSAGTTGRGTSSTAQKRWRFEDQFSNTVPQLSFGCSHGIGGQRKDDLRERGPPRVLASQRSRWNIGGSVHPWLSLIPRISVAILRARLGRRLRASRTSRSPQHVST